MSIESAEEIREYVTDLLQGNEGKKGQFIEELVTKWQKNDQELTSDEEEVLTAKLYEIKPDIAGETYYTTNNQVTKIVSVAFPFVNGMFELPGKELTNIFANAKISFQISFQALQAFFPWSPSIDGLPSGHQLAGLGKALNIGNAIPIYNEAFNYLAFLSE